MALTPKRNRAAATGIATTPKGSIPTKSIRRLTRLSHSIGAVRIMVDRFSKIFFPHPAPQGEKTNQDNDLIEALAAMAAPIFATSRAEILSDGRGSRKAAAARMAVAYVANTILGLTFRRIGDALRRDHSTCVDAAKRIEDLRDHPDLNSRLTRLEMAAAALIDPPANAYTSKVAA